MSDVMEEAPSGRAKCRGCKKSIAKGEVRFGEAAPHPVLSGEVSYRWYHVDCAAKALPFAVERALDADAHADLNVDAAAVRATLDEAKKTEKPDRVPFAERAPSGRSRCLGCSKTIVKDALRVAVLREVDAGRFTRTAHGYLHVSCAPGWLMDNDLYDTLVENSPQLDEGDRGALMAELVSAPDVALPDAGGPRVANDEPEQDASDDVDDGASDDELLRW